MVDEDEPPDRHREKANLISTLDPVDLSGILLTADPKNGIMGYCNMDVCDTKTPDGYPAIIRKISYANNPTGQISEIVATHLVTPTQLSDKQKVIAGADNSFARCGVEDGRIKMGPDGNLYIVGPAYDGQDNRLVGYVTSPDFKDIEPLGIIGPQIKIPRAIDIVGQKTLMGKILLEELQIEKQERKNALVSDKDASIYFNYQQIGLFGRKAKCINYHTIKEFSQKGHPSHYQIMSALKELNRKEYWEYEFENLRERTIMTPEEGWEKVGLGTAPNSDNVGTCHRSYKRNIAGMECWFYEGGFFTFNPKSKQVISRLRSALFTPDLTDTLIKYSGDRPIVIKYVAFPMGKIKQGEREFIYIGAADNKTKYRSTLRKWLKEELENPHNQQKILNFKFAA